MIEKEINNDEYKELPQIPKLEIYKETFGELKNITEEWYKNNRG